MDPSILDEIPQLPIIKELDALPTLAEVQKATASLKNHKAAGPDDIPAELLKHGDDHITNHLHELFKACWVTGSVPQDLKDGKIVTIHKRGNKTLCNNSRGITLLSNAGKTLARIMLTPLLTHVAEKILPESQCGFRKERSTIDMVFVARQLQEKCREQHQNLYIAFVVDLTKAFDTVHRTLLWQLPYFPGHKTRF